MVNLSLLQVNLGRGKAATSLLQNRVREEKIDLVAIQEPSRSNSGWGDAACFGGEGNTKVLTVVRNSSLKPILLQDVSNKNCIAIKLQGDEEDLVIVNVYAEPGGQLDGILDCVEQVLGKYHCPFLILGDFNAKSPAWGGEITDRRGVLMMDFIGRHDLYIDNSPDDQATFSSTNGQSWIDLTLSRRVDVSNWRVEEEETLSDHRYIRYELEVDEPRITAREVRFNVKKADWQVFQARLKELIRDLPAEVTYSEQVNEIAEEFQQACLEACKASMPMKKPIGASRESAVWWNDSLREKRREVRRARKRYQTEQDQERRAQLQDAFKALRREYKLEILAARKDCFRSYCTENARSDPWGLAYKILAKKRKKRAVPKTIQRENGTWTTNEEETVSELLYRYFPQDDPATDSDEHQIERDGQEEPWGAEQDQPFTISELRFTIAQIPKDKAPGIDGFPPRALDHVMAACEERYLVLLNSCFRFGVFPNIWKKASVVWIPKPENKGYRPICLLPVLGKVLDKLCAFRLSYFMERGNLISPNQFGFRSGRSTVMAVRQAVDHAKQAKRSRQHCLMVALDVKNAFNSAWYPRLLTMLKNMKVPSNLGTTISSFLEQRTVTSGNIEKDMERGCPQGSCLGPILWLVLMEDWFQEVALASDRGDGDRVQAFADDQLIILVAPSAKKLERQWKYTWEACQRWALRNKLEYCADKTTCIFVNATDLRRPPVLRMENTIIRPVFCMKYLGLILDRKFLWVEHAKMVRERVTAIAHRLYLVAGKTWGLDQEVRRLIYLQAIEPMILYGSEIWGERATDSRIVRHMEAAQRPFLLSICRAYRTTATKSLQVIAGIVPLWIMLQVRQERTTDLEGEEYERCVQPAERPHPARRGLLQYEERKAEDQPRHLEIYTDGSKQEGRVGFAVIARGTEGETSVLAGKRLPDFCSVFQAEMAAIREAVEWCRVNIADGSRVDICSDSKSALQAVTTSIHRDKTAMNVYNAIENCRERNVNLRLRWVKAHVGIPGNELADTEAKNATQLPDWTYQPRPRSTATNLSRTKGKNDWQVCWDIATQGRSTYEILPRVGTVPHTLAPEAVQVITGHGKFNQYYCRFHLRQVQQTCICDLDEPDTSDHVLWRCTDPRRETARGEFYRYVLGSGGPWPFRFSSDSSAEDYRRFNNMAKQMVFDYQEEQQ